MARFVNEPASRPTAPAALNPPPFCLPLILKDWPADAAPPLYPYLHGGSWQSGDFSLSPDPLRSYLWESRFLKDPREPLQCYAALPISWALESGQIGGLETLGQPRSILKISGPCCLRMDFGVEAAAWLEFGAWLSVGGLVTQP